MKNWHIALSIIGSTILTLWITYRILLIVDPIAGQTHYHRCIDYTINSPVVADSGCIWNLDDDEAWGTKCSFALDEMCQALFWDSHKAYWDEVLRKHRAKEIPAKVTVCCAEPGCSK